MVKKKYSIDLAGLMAECEANYMRIVKLLPEMSAIDVREFAVELAGSSPIQFRMEVKERCKYTTMVDISQQPLKTGKCHQAQSKKSDESPSEGSILAKAIKSWIASPTFSLRIYHDAQMAEVISYDNHHRLHIKYDYPNNNMYQSDEKAQLNTLLGEWLSHCLQYGRVLNIAASSVYS